MLRHGGCRRTAFAVVVFLAATPGVFAQALPHLPLESYPEVARTPIAQALAEARAHPADAGRVGHLAMVLHAWEQFEAAAEVYARARALERRVDWFYLGGLVEARRARHGEAARLLAEAVKLSPDYTPARLALADALFESGDVAGAEREYAALTTGDSEPHARYGLGRALAARGEYARAVGELDVAVRLFPEFGAAWYARGMALRKLERLEEARQALERAREYGTRWPAVADTLLARVRGVRDDPAAHVDRGLSKQKEGDLAGAVLEYEAAVAANPRTAPAHVNLIAVYCQQREWTKAEAHYTAVLQFDPGVAEAHFNFGVCLATQGNVAAAADVFHKALAINPQYAGAWSSLGQLNEMGGRLDEAEADYRKAAEYAPGDATSRFNVARMLIARQAYPDAIAELEPLAAREHPDRARFLFGLATAHVHAGHAAEGRRYATEARDLARAQGQLDLAAAIDRELSRLP